MNHSQNACPSFALRFITLKYRLIFNFIAVQFEFELNFDESFNCTQPWMVLRAFFELFLYFVVNFC